MTDGSISKRLIISGLTPSITLQDLSKKLTNFGTVKATDGFGLLDGVGQPRKFAYVTLDTTKVNLAKCMNLLSGTTWKGTKLRIGEAKPDFRERLAKEREEPPKEPRKRKRQSKFEGTLASDMSLVTPEIAKSKPGWQVSELGRITRPMKMRPERPLPPVQEATTSNVAPFKKKKRVKQPDNRARVKTIDMTKWGSTHLTGMFLDIETVGPPRLKLQLEDEEIMSTDESSSSESEVEHISPNDGKRSRNDRDLATTADSTPVSTISSPTVVKSLPLESPSKLKARLTTSSTPGDLKAPEAASDILREKAQSLALLSSLFDNDDDDWVGRESVASDIDAEELLKGDKMLVDEEDPGFEVVPLTSRGRANSIPREKSSPPEQHREDGVRRMAAQTTTPMPKGDAKKPSALKSLFAPREEEGGFSFLANLDLDMELDDEVPFVDEHPSTMSEQQDQPFAFPSGPITIQSHSSQSRIVLNPKQSLFFPYFSDGHANKARPKDVFDVMKEDHWDWRDPAVSFYRTESEEQIRKRWEECKGDLTQDWKKRARESVKASRRRKTGADVDNE